jgi:hypothetical protein
MNYIYCKKLLLILIVSTWYQFTAYSQEIVTCDSLCQCYQNIDNLNLRIDSLEASLEKLQIQVIESDPLKSAKYLHWGNGLMFAITKSEQRISTDAGYTFVTPKSFRMGIAAGFEGEMGAVSTLPAYSFFGKVTYGTPIFINFISINTYARALFYPKGALTENVQATGGLSAGAEFEFWFSPSWCYTFGGSITAMRYKYFFDSATLGEVNFAGMKYFPQCSRKKK